MDRAQLLALLDEVRTGKVAPAAAAHQIGDLPYAEVVHAVGTSMIDHHRELRTGVPELVFGASKTAEQIAGTLGELGKRGAALATRVDAAKAARVKELLPDVVHRRGSTPGRAMRSTVNPPSSPTRTQSRNCDRRTGFPYDASAITLYSSDERWKPIDRA